MSKIIFGSVVYSEAKEYICDFLKSLEEQTFHEFCILLVNDNIKEEVLETILKNHSSIKDKIVVVNTQGKYKPYELRVILLIEAKKLNGDLLILGDCDDVFSSDRIKIMVEAFKKDYTFFYNSLCDWNGEYIMENMPAEINDFKDIGEKNFLGFSTTALNMKKLDEKFINSLFEGETPIFDWYVYSRILLTGGIGLCVPEGRTFYRLHNNNIAGVCHDDVESINREIEIKIRHYELLEKYDVYYKKLLEKYRYIRDNNLYMKYINPLKYGFWWENIDILNAEGE